MLQQGCCNYESWCQKIMNLSTYIEQDLREKVSQGGDLPSSLTLAGLAKQYDVSIMPVRVAIESLIDDGILHKLENGRLSVNPSALGKQKQKRNGRRHSSINAPIDWHQRIQQDVVRKSLSQYEEVLTIDGTAETYGIGRAVARKHLIRLAGQGLLEHTPRKSWRVRPFKEKDLDDYLDVRSILEVRALDIAKDSLKDEDLQEMMEQNQPTSKTSPAKLDHRLHQYWIEKSGNRYIIDFYCRHSHFYLGLYHYAVEQNPSFASKVAKQHRIILGAVLKKHWHQARVALTDDIVSLRPILLSAIQDLAESE